MRKTEVPKSGIKTIRRAQHAPTKPKPGRYRPAPASARSAMARVAAR